MATASSSDEDEGLNPPPEPSPEPEEQNAVGLGADGDNESTKEGESDEIDGQEHEADEEVIREDDKEEDVDVVLPDKTKRKKGQLQQSADDEQAPDNEDGDVARSSLGKGANVASTKPVDRQLHLPAQETTKKKVRRKKKEDKEKKHEKLLREKLYPPIKATTYTLNDLSSLRANYTSCQTLYSMDFTDFIEQYGIDELDQLFPKCDGCGNLDPPTRYLGFGYQICEWRLLDDAQQRTIIEFGDRVNEADERRRREMERSGSSEEEKEGTSDTIDVVRRDAMNNTTTFASTNETTNAYYSIKNATAFQGMMNPMMAQYAAAYHGNPMLDPYNFSMLTHPMRLWWPGPNNAFGPAQRIPCQGVTKELIDAGRLEHKAEILEGFNKLVGDAVRYRAHHLSNNNCEWHYGDGVEGFLTSKKPDEEYSWKCIKLSSLSPMMTGYGFRRHGCNEYDTTNNDGKKWIQFSKKGAKICDTCFARRHKFYTLCRTEMALRKKDPSEIMSSEVSGSGRALALRSPDIVMPIIEGYKRKIHIMQKRDMYRKEKGL